MEPDVLVRGTYGKIAEVRPCGCWVIYLAATTAVALCDTHQGPPRERVMALVTPPKTGEQA